MLTTAIAAKVESAVAMPYVVRSTIGYHSNS